MKVSLLHFLATIASTVTSHNLNNLRGFDETIVVDGEQIEEDFLDTLSEEKKDRALENAACDEICIARRRLVRCKKKAREEKRQGRNAWKTANTDRVPNGSRRLKLYCEWKLEFLYCF